MTTVFDSDEILCDMAVCTWINYIITPSSLFEVEVGGGLTLCGLKTRRFFKACLKRIVNYPSRRSRQLPVRQVLQLRLLLIFLLLLWVHQFLMLNAPWFTIACLPRLRLCRDEINQGFLLNKTLLCADGYSYLLINSIMSRRINSPLALPPRIYCQVASVPFVLFGDL